MQPQYPLRGKVALVFGGSRGIGAVIAMLFARQGIKEVIGGRDQATLPARQVEIEYAAAGLLLAHPQVRNPER